MPEGHSILRASKLWETMVGPELQISSPQGRFSAEAIQLSGLKLLRAEPYGKHLFLHFEEQKIVHIHLALYGKHYVFKTPVPTPKPTVRLRVQSSEKTIDLIGPAVCELLTPSQHEAILKRLGPDPLKLEQAPADFLEKMSKLNRPVAQVLMDQSLIAGIGNVYRAESLFFRALNPYLKAKSISELEWKGLWKISRELLLAGSKLKGRTYTFIPDLTLPKTMKTEPPEPTASRFTYVYGSTGLPCLACATPIVAQLLNGRTLYYCPTCQS